MADIHAQCLHREGKLRGMIEPTTSHLKDAITVFTQPQAARLMRSQSSVWWFYTHIYKNASM